MRTAFLFPGQGSQCVGMGKSILNNFPYVGSLFDEASDIAHLNLRTLLVDSPIESLQPMIPAQISIFTINAAYCQILKNEFGLAAQFAAGNSLGEISALHYAGAFDFLTGLKLVIDRATSMDNSCRQSPGKMIAITGGNYQQLINYMRSLTGIWISGFNSVNQWILSGYTAQINNAIAQLQEQGWKTSLLSVSGACHCPIMETAKEQWSKSLTNLCINDLNVQVISSLTGQPYPYKETITHHLLNQLVQPCYWSRVMDYLNSRFCDLYIEVGSGTAYKKMLMTQHKKAQAFSLSSQTDLVALHSYLDDDHQQKKTQVSYDSPIAQLIRIILSLPAPGIHHNSNFPEAQNLMNEIYDILNRKSQPILFSYSDFQSVLKNTRKILQLKGYSSETISKLLEDFS